jgi:hypothetical protein
MLVPAMQRQKHDARVNKALEYQSEIAKVKPTDRDWEEASKEKERLNRQMSDYIDKIDKEGYDNTKDNFLKLNRDYQSSVSPTGKIGMFNDAYVKKEQNKAEFLKNATALGYSPEEVQNKLMQIEEEYNNSSVYDEKGRVTLYNTDKYMPPKYINHIEEAQKLYKETGMTSNEWKNVVSGITFDPMSNQYVNTITKGGGFGKNKEQRDAVVNFMNDRIINEQGDIRQTLDWRNYDPNRALKEIQNMSGIYAKNSTNNISGNEISNVKYYDPGSASGDGSENSPIIYSHISEDLPVGDDYTKVIKESNNIINNPKASAQEKNMARQKLDLIDEIKAEISEKDKNFADKNKYTESIKNNAMISNLIIKAKNDKKLNETAKKQLISNLEEIKNKYRTGEIITSKYLPKDEFKIGGTPLQKYAGIPEEIVNEYKKEINQFNKKHLAQYAKYIKEVDEKINTSLSTRGIAATKLSYNYKNQAAKDTEMMNLKDALDVDFARASDIIYINKNGSKERIKIDEAIAGDAINMLKNSDEKSMNANITHRGNVIGITVKYNPHKDNKLTPNGLWNNKSFGNGESIEMFVPITNLSDGIT